ncbi:MAG: DinB family protein [Cryomorphaceae bacterium]|nr:MAG: DinB family protein [Cryomorphaceae bacterium]
MHQSIAPHWEKLTLLKNEWIAQLETLPQETCSARLAQGWNILQVVEHVITSETGTLGYMKKKTAAPWSEIPLANENHVSKGRQLNEALKSEKRWKAPDVLPDPTGSQSFDNMAKYWDGLRGEYQGFLSDLDPAYFERTIFRHPYSGPLDLYHTLDFLCNHILHHQYQVERIKVML